MQQVPHLVEKELHRHDVGAVGEAADEENAAGDRPGGLSYLGAEAFEIHAVGERDGGRGGHHAAVLLAHGDDAVHGAPRGGFEFAPEA